MGGARARGLAVAVVVLGLLVIAVVARSSPSHPLHATTAPPASESARVRPPPSQLPDDGTHAAAAAPSRGHKSHSNWLARAVLVALAAALGWAAWWLCGLRRPRRVARGARHGRADVAEAGGALASDDVGKAVDQSIDAIERGLVTDAIIACWVLVEQAAASAGVAIRLSETSSEFVDRVLSSYGAREPALRRLAALYREARFSDHAMGEPSRDEARACLADIRADLRAARAAR